MPLSVASTSVSGRDPVTFTNRVARTDTTAKDLFKLKRGWVPLSLSLYSAAASDAGTSALLSIGSTGNAAYFAGPMQVKTGMHSVLGPSTPSTVSNLMEPLAFDTVVTGTYAEYGTGSTAGGPWTVVLQVLRT
jgi:hypothetical protein